MTNNKDWRSQYAPLFASLLWHALRERSLEANELPAVFRLKNTELICVLQNLGLSDSSELSRPQKS